jgi:hypothetical protein
MKSIERCRSNLMTNHLTAGRNDFISVVFRPEAEGHFPLVVCRRASDERTGGRGKVRNAATVAARVGLAGVRQHIRHFALYVGTHQLLPEIGPPAESLLSLVASTGSRVNCYRCYRCRRTRTVDRNPWHEDAKHVAYDRRRTLGTNGWGVT